jgi:DNA repair exonuclease SbcCD nuclease subunit
VLITTDLHLTARERDEYRWDLFPWLLNQMGSSHQDLAILGDITDQKDGHSSVLVNRVVSNLVMLTEKGKRVFVVKGNHDYVDPDLPFFLFLRHLYGVRFFSNPWVTDTEVGPVLFLPHDRNPVKAWESIAVDKEDIIMCHQTFDGALAHGGHAMQSSVGPRYFSKRGSEALVLSGDIHKPQEIGDVTYVGTPYPVSFAESHQPRVLSLTAVGDELEIGELFPPSIRKMNLTIDSAADIPVLKSGDQLKIKLAVHKEDLGDWDVRREAIIEKCKIADARIRSLELIDQGGKTIHQAAPKQGKTSARPEDVLSSFCSERLLSDGEHHAAQDILAELK